MIEIKWNPSTRELRQFAGLLAVLLFGIAGTIWYRGGSSGLILGLSIAAVSVLVAGLAVPSLLRFVYVGWLVAVFPIGWLVSHLLLAMIFYLVFTPIGWILRLTGQDLMGRRMDRQVSTYWTPHKKTEDRNRYFRQF